MNLWVPGSVRQRAVVRTLLRSHGLSADFVHAICMMDRGTLRAAAAYSDFSCATCQIQIAAVSGNQPWCNRHFLWAIFDYPFVQCAVAELVAWVRETNTRMRSILERLGFCLRHSALDGYAPGCALLLFTLRACDVRVFGRYAR